jgi:hypothetical protein
VDAILALLGKVRKSLESVGLEGEQATTSHLGGGLFQFFKGTYSPSPRSIVVVSSSTIALCVLNASKQKYCILFLSYCGGLIVVV